MEAENLQQAADKNKLLSQREEQVLSLLCDGHFYRIIGQKLRISTHTVRKHATNIYKKLGVRNKTQAMMKWYME
jgi:DNA-binding NarL/FixJ family response regulator